MTKPDKRDEHEHIDSVYRALDQIIARDREAFADSYKHLDARIDAVMQEMATHFDRIRSLERRGILRRIARAISCAFEELFG